MFYPTKKLSDLLETCDAGVWGKPAVKGKGLFVLRSTNMTNDGELNFSDVAERKIEGDTKKTELLDGDILVEKSGGGPDQPVGRVGYFTAPNQGAYTFTNFIQRLRAKSDLVNSRFLFYRLLFLHKIGFTKKLQSQTTGIRNLKLSLYLKTEIPLPPLQIQKQIVERLDKIAEAQKLNDGLIQKTDELFQSLLYKELNPASNKDWGVKKLEEVLDYEQPTKYIISSTDYKDDYLIPVLTAGKSFILGYTNENSGIFPKEKLPVIIFDDFTTAIKFVDFPFKVKSSAMKILHAKKDKADINFLFYTLQTIKFIPAQHKRYWISEYSQIEVRIPSLKTQKQVVAKLSAVQDYKKQLLGQKAKLKELFDSALARSMRLRTSGVNDG